ncbi:hypothetical protein M3899_003162 [Vibrio parahaemolyticus]|nr:hypothetical protein [Vibrio parahaemolyticus]
MVVKGKQRFLRWVGDNCAEVADFLNSEDFHHKRGKLIIHLGNVDLLIWHREYVVIKEDGSIASVAPVRINGAWNTHELFQTVSHQHITIPIDDQLFDVLLVECADGRWFANDEVGNLGAYAGRFFSDSRPLFEEPAFYTSLQQAEIVICQAIAATSSTQFESIYPYFEN